ncbi:MAG: ABC transporter ATP-binding protein [Actinomycetota bacterium]|nr:ABC transporter ATP-binding protein [Actinomycetota bacterium]
MSSAASTAAPATTLAARSLSKHFGDRAALSEVSFELAPGELVGIIGPNGAGKTTLLSILAGVLAPDGGQLSRPAREIGWVPQQPALYSKLSVAENLRLFARLEKAGDPEAAVARMLEQTSLQDRADEEVSRLSGGNQQRVNIAIGLLSQPSVLLLDEPSAALDPRQRERLWEFILALAQGGTTVVFSTHNVSEVERYATRVLLLADGELLFTGTPAQLQVEVGAPPAPGSIPRQGPDLESALVGFLHRRGH